MKVDRHPQFRQSRCLFVVRSDGGWIDFSYQKCLRAYIRDKYPSYAERFIKEHFKRSSWIFLQLFTYVPSLMSTRSLWTEQLIMLIFLLVDTNPLYRLSRKTKQLYTTIFLILCLLLLLFLFLFLLKKTCWSMFEITLLCHGIPSLVYLIWTIIKCYCDFFAIRALQ